MRLETFLRAVSWVVLTSFTSLNMQPLSAAIQLRTAHDKSASPPKTADEKYASVLGKIEDQVKRAKINHQVLTSSKPEAKLIRSLKKNLDNLNSEIESAFAATEKHLNDKNLAPVIKDRHTEAVRQFGIKKTEFAQMMAALENADDGESDDEIDMALAALSVFFEKYSQRRKHSPLDPKNLPWRTPKSEVRAPITNSGGFKTAQFGFDYPKFAGTVPTGTVLPKALSAGPTAAELAETEDVQITSAIRAKAQELGNHPVAILNFVTNNVRFTPTYGSVQGSQDTLDKLSGNAFDTASLLIALYRAAGIPARYGYGTIEVPIDKLMNWVGGVSNADAAQQLLGQGGIPNSAVISGGRVSAVRLEHVWVEAWVQYYPSRASKHAAGQGNTWKPVDASFKTYAFTQGMDLQTSVPFDGSALAAGAQQGAIVNLTEGWVQNLNQANIQTTFNNYESQLKSYVDSQKPGATVGEVLGTQTIVARNLSILAGSLPYETIAKGPVYAALPAGLRHQFQYRLYASSYDRNLDSPVWTFQRSLPELAGKKITLSFTPASQADADLIASYQPQPHPGGSPIQPNEFPSSIPAYATVVPELRIDDEVVVAGGAFKLGAELAGLGGFTQYDFSGWDLTPDDTIHAGQTTAFGMNLQGVSQAQLIRLKTRIDESRDQLASGAFANLTGGHLIGDPLTNAVWGYFWMLDQHGVLAKTQSRMADIPGLSYGLFHAALQPIKLFGAITTGVKFSGLLMDIGHLRHVRWSLDNDRNKWVQYNRSRGHVASALESVVPENYFIDHSQCNRSSSQAPDPTKPACPEAASAVKVIAVAQALSQRVFTITASNLSVVGSLQHSEEIKQDIRNAVGAGKEVTVSEGPVSMSGWSGSGYIIMDPETGSGAYLIEGKANGGAIALLFFLGYMALFITALGVTTLATALLPILIIALMAEIIVLADLPFDAMVFALARVVGTAIAAAIALPGAILAYVLSIVSLFVTEFFYIISKGPKGRRRFVPCPAS